VQIWLRRAYDEPGQADGRRVLVDRVWPRGVSREQAAVDEWLRDAAPSDELRKWFGHAPERWEEFRRRYFRELDTRPEAVDRLAEWVREGRVTLVFGAREERFNNAVALKEYLEKRLG
jgi:uncharacterized protein YeaO (DUF488 family)